MAWEDVGFRVEPIDAPNVEEFVTAFGHVYANGGVIVRSLRATNETEFDHALRSDTRGIDHVFRATLTCASAVAALPELQIQMPLKRPPKFRWLSAFGVEGELTHLLLVGGAYERFGGSVGRARRLSRRFMEALFGARLNCVGLAGSSSTPWTPWFFDIAWDATFVLYEPQARRVVLVCMTDTD